LPDFHERREVYSITAAPITELTEAQLIAMFAIGLGQMIGDDGVEPVIELTIATVGGESVTGYGPISLVDDVIESLTDARDTYRRMTSG
jgi:hypothetical protein